ncbi:MAG: ROK family protein [Opitutaceae bacterium]|jgi:predicted NBD/HSP70 family sugar kinase
MIPKSGVFIGTDSGATTSKTGGVWMDGSTISTKLRQSSTNCQAGTAAVIKGWIEGVEGFLAENNLTWKQVQGVGLAIPGPYLRYGVLGHAANLPAAFEGWEFAADYSKALAQAAGRPIDLVAGNDGRLGGVAEAKIARGDAKASVLMLAPGSGLGSAFIDANGLPLDGDTLGGMETAHMPAALHLLGMRAFPCGCGRTWGCAEIYTTLAGLPFLLEEILKKYPNHELAKSTLSPKEKAFTLRTRAQNGDPLAVEIFDFQAKAMGLHVASLVMALDPSYVVIGGGLMDPESTSFEFRERYLRILSESAQPYFWPVQRGRIKIVAASLGELSQAIGAALVALYTAKARGTAS